MQGGKGFRDLRVVTAGPPQQDGPGVLIPEGVRVLPHVSNQVVHAEDGGALLVFPNDFGIVTCRVREALQLLYCSLLQK